MNEVVTDYLISKNIIIKYERFNVFYDKVAQKYWFGNTVDKFILTFNNQLLYDLSPCDQNNIWCQYTKWGLPSYLGCQFGLL